MHPYYGTERLTGVSPTLIESVDNAVLGLPTAVPAGPPGTGGTGVTGGVNSVSSDGQQPVPVAQPSTSVDIEPVDLQILQNLSLSQPGAGLAADTSRSPTNASLLGSHRPTARLSNSSESAGRSGMVYSSVGGSGGFLGAFQHNPVPTSYAMSHHGANGFGSHPSVYMPVATSTPFFQFTTPVCTDSLYTQPNTSQGPHVSFHFSSPTFSTPPIQMMAPPLAPTHIGLLSSGMTSSSWQHKVPTSMPWAGTSQNSSSGIEFTATGSSANVMTSSHRTRSSPCNGKRAEKKKVPKRKLRVLSNDVPEKVHINEERMAAHLQELHLDNNNLQWHPDLEEQWYTQQQQYKSDEQAGDSSTGDDDEEEEHDCATDQTHSECRSSPSKNTLQARLEFSDMLQMGMKSREILPKVILDEINRPCMQIVLWKPPGNFVADMVRDSVWDSSQSNDEMIDNNQSDSTIQYPFVWKCAEGKSENAEVDDMDL